MSKLKILSLFSGIGAFEKALTNINIPYEVVNYCEINPSASKAYSLIHNEPETKNLGDITKVDEKELEDFDLMTWGFCCQDISISGKQKGFIDEKGNITRSGLYHDGMRILKHKRPKYSIIENVKNLLSTKFKTEFLTILKDLDDAGYNTHYQVLNSKYFDIPQNRERVFIVSIRKDLDDTFHFPIQRTNTKKRIRDILDSDVDSKYYLKDFQAERLDVTYKILNYNDCRIKFLGNTHPSNDGMSGDVFCESGICRTLVTVVTRIRTVEGLRHLTECESFKLMGFTEDDYRKVEGQIRSVELYKAAGNSIVVNVLEGILINLIDKEFK